jgi:hypothetical protein
MKSVFLTTFPKVSTRFTNVAPATFTGNTADTVSHGLKILIKSSFTGNV